MFDRHRNVPSVLREAQNGSASRRTKARGTGKMNTRDMHLKVQAYLDNELSPAEARKVGTWISSNPEARDLFNELKETREILMQNEPVLALPESRDFFWSKIERG